MDNHLSELTDSELASVGRMWHIILQNRALYAALPCARQLLRAYLTETRQRRPAHKFKPIYSPSGRGGYLRLLAACGDSVQAAAYDHRR